MPSDLPADLCTHIVFASAQIPNGENTLEPYETNDISELYPATAALKQQNTALKVTLSVGGWSHSSEPFTAMVATGENRQEFITNSITYLRTHGFDGLDIAWQYPGEAPSPASDVENLSLLCEEMKAAFVDESTTTGNAQLLLTAAVAAAPWTVASGYDVPRLSAALDFVHIMAYNLHGGWEAKLGLHSQFDAPDGDVLPGLATNAIIQNWMNRGLSASKLVIGMPTYGRGFTLTDSAQTTPGSPASGSSSAGPYTSETGLLAYYEICEKISQNGWIAVKSDEMQSMYAYGDGDWVGYENQETLSHRCGVINSMGLAGVMFWDTSLDDTKGLFCDQGPYPLISLFQTCLN